MQRLRLLPVALLSALLGAGGAQAAPGIEGGSGILATPTAEVVADGTVVFTLGRGLSRSLQTRGESIARSYSATIGYLPDLEIVARLNDYPLLSDSNNLANFQDRSVGVKYRFYNADGWQLAAGAVDVGGESQTQETYYGVASYSPSEELTLSAGAGSGALEGVFGSLRYSPQEWLALLGEYDTENFNYGVELRPLKGLSLKGGIANEHATFNMSYSFPMDPRGRQTPCCPVSLPRCEVEYNDPCEQNAALRDALVCESFENVLVGSDGSTLIVEFENRRFREQIDALAFAALTAYQHAGSGIERIVLSPKIDDVPQLSLSLTPTGLQEFLAHPDSSCACFSVGPYEKCAAPDAVYAEEANIKNGHGEVMLRPTQSLVVAESGQPTWRTTFGLGLTEEVYLARGLRLVGRQDWPAFNDINGKTDAVSRDALLHYHDAWSPQFFVHGTAGYYGNGMLGSTFEAAQYFDGGRFKLGARYAGLQNSESGAADSEDGAALGELAWSEPSLDWQLTALGGEFMDGDQGFRLESRRWFGPTELTFFAYDSDTSKPEGGFRFFVPLPLYDEGRHGDWRAGVAPYFNYQYRTDSDPNGNLPLGGIDLDEARARLRPEYVVQHLDAFRRVAWLWFNPDNS